MKGMNYHDYIWDLGGTLLDNYGMSTKAFVATLADFGLTATYKQVYDKLRESTDTAISYFVPNCPAFREAYKKNEKISGLTPLQRYFLGYALGWLYQTRKEELASRLLTDVHSPAKQRVNGPFPNVPEFYEAFGIKQGDKMYLPDSLRVKLW